MSVTPYSALKLLHVSCIVVSGLGFLLRYSMVRREWKGANTRVPRRAPCR
jgi:hypothetical protein